MAQKTVVQLVDDLDGGAADETLRFSVNGNEYEIDLSRQHADQLRTALLPYTQVARRAGRAPGATRRSGGRSAAGGGGDRDRNRAIRDWATQNGIVISARGRIADDVIAQYEAATRR